MSRPRVHLHDDHTFVSIGFTGTPDTLLSLEGLGWRDRDRVVMWCAAVNRILTREDTSMAVTTDVEAILGIEVLRSMTLKKGADAEFSPRWDALGRDNAEFGGAVGRWFPSEEADRLLNLDSLARALEAHDPPLTMRIIPPAESTPQRAGSTTWIVYAWPVGAEPANHNVWISAPTMVDAIMQAYVKLAGHDVDVALRPAGPPCTCGIVAQPPGPNHAAGCPAEVTAETIELLREMIAAREASLAEAHSSRRREQFVSRTLSHACDERIAERDQERERREVAVRLADKLMAERDARIDPDSPAVRETLARLLRDSCGMASNAGEAISDAEFLLRAMRDA